MAKEVLKLMVLLVVNLSYVIGTDKNNVKKPNTPPHCTQLFKDTDYISFYKFDYPVSYIAPGQHEAFQKMFCINPPAVHKAETTVCDWAAPPQVQFTLGDEFLHVVRIDPTGRFLGNAIINTYQLCSHNITQFEDLNDVTVTDIEN